MKVFGDKMIRWYFENKRELPWRNTQDPYKIWLSEIILQQTRVDQGMAYYLKFQSLFPTVQALANASEDAVLKAWQGLGYYSRARNLHATAKMISDERKGVFPDSSLELRRLKGVGPYTAAAIASFCFHENIPVIDGNVIRVLGRLFRVEHPSDTKLGANQLQQLASDLIQKHDPANFNQAIMEFGALQCVPVNPNCGVCPMSGICKAYADDVVGLYPLKKKKTVVRDVWFYYFVLSYRGNKYVKRRNEKGIWHGLYDFPLTASDTELDVTEVLGAFLNGQDLLDKATFKGVSEEFTHILSHRKIHAFFIELQLNEPWSGAPENIMEVSSKKLQTLGIPRLIDRYLHRS